MVTVQMGAEEFRIVGRTVEGEGTWATLIRNDIKMMVIPASDPFPALTIAKAAVKKYGAKILSQEPPSTQRGMVY